MHYLGLHNVVVSGLVGALVWYEDTLCHISSEYPDEETTQRRIFNSFIDRRSVRFRIVEKAEEVSSKCWTGVAFVSKEGVHQMMFDGIWLNISGCNLVVQVWWSGHSDMEREYSKKTTTLYFCPKITVICKWWLFLKENILEVSYTLIWISGWEVINNNIFKQEYGTFRH